MTHVFIDETYETVLIKIIKQIYLLIEKRPSSFSKKYWFFPRVLNRVSTGELNGVFLFDDLITKSEYKHPYMMLHDMFNRGAVATNQLKDKFPSIDPKRTLFIAITDWYSLDGCILFDFMVIVNHKADKNGVVKNYKIWLKWPRTQPYHRKINHKVTHWELIREYWSARLLLLKGIYYM